jgi:hypothetical protein
MFDAQNFIQLVERELETSGSFTYLDILDTRLAELRRKHVELSNQARMLPDGAIGERSRAILSELAEVESAGMYMRFRREKLVLFIGRSKVTKPTGAPQLGERILLLILTKEERVNIPGDLEEEFRQIMTKHGVRYAKLWYYKQVAASAWPLMRKAVGWGLLTSLGAWLRRIM